MSTQPPVAPDPDGPLDPMPAERATAVLDSYRRTTEAMREATKWVMAVLPGAGLVIALASIVPKLANLDDSSDRTDAIILTACGVAAAIVVLVLAARVLTVSQTGWGTIADTIAKDIRRDPVGDGPKRSLRAEIASEQVLRLHGYSDISEFADDLVERRATPSAVAAGSSVIDFVEFRTVRGRFWAFAIGGSVAAAAAIMLFTLARITIADAENDQSSHVVAPLAVRVVPTPSGEAAIGAVSGCQLAGKSDGLNGWIIAGSLEQAVIIIDDDPDACPPIRLDWHADTMGLLVPSTSS